MTERTIFSLGASSLLKVINTWNVLPIYAGWSISIFILVLALSFPLLILALSFGIFIVFLLRGSRNYWGSIFICRFGSSLSIFLWIFLSSLVSQLRELWVCNNLINSFQLFQPVLFLPFSGDCSSYCLHKPFICLILMSFRLVLVIPDGQMP